MQTPDPAAQKMTLAAWLRRHPLLGYFATAYGISWGGILIVMSTTGFDLVRLRAVDTGCIFGLMLLGPSAAGLASIALQDGRQGLRELRRSLLRWRIHWPWYAVALLTAPALLLGVLLPFGVVDAAYAPRFQWPLLAIGLVAGSLEEIGWTGFATPRLLARERLLAAGLSLGLVWAMWHLLVDFRQNAHAMGAVWLAEFAILYLAALSAYRVLMTWVFAHTQSLLLAVLMHASYTGWLLAVFPATSARQGLAWQAAFATLLWIAVAVVMAIGANRTVQATTHERQRSLPGDALVPDAGNIVMHAVTIAAPVERVWPWLVQMGAGRAGWYSYDGVDNGGRPSATKIVPGLQHLAPGDVMPSLPGANDSFVVGAVEAGRDLVLTVPAAGGGLLVSWEFFLEPVARRVTRLLVRGRLSSRWPAGGAGRTVISPRPIEHIYALLARVPRWLMAPAARLGHGVMQARQLRGIKQRAEATGPIGKCAAVLSINNPC